MNMAELLDQFIQESREGLELIGKRLLEVERNPTDAALLNDLFRQVHTLKGNCGLFDFKALERVVHAGEDLLDQVRHGSLAYRVDIADALLEAMDYTAELVDAIALTGALPADADARAQVLAAALRRNLESTAGAAEAPASQAPVAASPPNPPPTTAPTMPDWAARVPEAWRQAEVTALLYRPEPECFFKGEDPWHLARSAPGLQHLAVSTQEPWAPPESFDCYRCNLELLVVSDAPRQELEQHFRYVPEQLSWWSPSAAARPAGDCEAPECAMLRGRVFRLWDEQRSLLAVPSVADSAIASARMVLRNLLTCSVGCALDAWGTAAMAQDALAALEALPTDAPALAAWAQHHAPQGAGAQGAAVSPSPAAPGVAAAPPARPPSSPPPPPPRGEEGGAAVGGARQVKVAQEKIDRLMALIGEMVVAKNALPYLAERAENHYKQRELAREIKAQYAVINRIAEDMQHGIMQVRMLPVGAVFQRFGRLVRDISHKLGKDVRLVVEGEDTEADKNIIEALADPLIHILRNSLDHGLELPAVRVAAGKPAQGTLRVTARQEADRVTLEISDDGAGVDTERVRAKAVERGLITPERAAAMGEHEAVQLIFLAGFSTAESISDLSGRGVGMDVVRTAVERVNGSVALSSERGRGTRIVLSLPLSMAVTNVMMIEASGSRMGVPMDLIVETVRVAAEDIHRFKNAQTAVLRGRIVPLRPLADLLALDAPPRCNDSGEHAVLVVRQGDENVGLIVDDFHGTSDIILKPLEGVLAGVVGFAGTALMGDGSVLMVLNPKELL